MADASAGLPVKLRRAWFKKPGRPHGPDGCRSKVNVRSANPRDPKNPRLARSRAHRETSVCLCHVYQTLRRIHTPRRNEWSRAGRAVQSITDSYCKREVQRTQEAARRKASAGDRRILIDDAFGKPPGSSKALLRARLGCTVAKRLTLSRHLRIQSVEENS